MTRAMPSGPLARLRVLATSDLHAQIFPWDYISDRAEPGRGLARTATLIARARAEVPASLLLDNGDFIQGSPLGDLMAARSPQGGPHPMIAAMNHLRYDAATLGNHEFSHGLPFLDGVLQHAAFPVVSANLFYTTGNRPFRPPFAVLTRQVSLNGRNEPLRIGIIGFAPPQLEQWDHHHIAGRLRTKDILASAALQVPLLRAQGVDLVIALSHSGIGPDQPHPDMEDATAALAAEAGIDVLIAGHTHQVFPGTRAAAGTSAGTGTSAAAATGAPTGTIDARRGRLHGKPAVMPGFYGSHLGVIDLWLARGAGGGWHIARHRAALRAIARRSPAGKLVARVPADPGVAALAAQAHADTLCWARRTVGQSPVLLHSYFALVQPCATVRLVARAQAAYVARALARSEWADLPVLSAAAPFRAGGRGGPENYTVIAAGPLALRHVVDLYLHPNTVTAIAVTGAELALWLERSAGLFRQVRPGLPDQPLIDEDFPSFNFECIEGVTYQIDLAVPARLDLRGHLAHAGAQRIRNLAFRGHPIAPEARFVLATNSYRTGGSGHFAGAEPGRVILPGTALARDVVLAHIARHGLDAAPLAPNWRFAPLDGASVLFDTSPDAARHLGDYTAGRIDAQGLTPEGFRRFRLHL